MRKHHENNTFKMTHKPQCVHWRRQIIYKPYSELYITVFESIMILINTLFHRAPQMERHKTERLVTYSMCSNNQRNRELTNFLSNIVINTLKITHIINTKLIEPFVCFFLFVFLFILMSAFLGDQILTVCACFLHSGLSFLEKKVWPSRLVLHTWRTREHYYTLQTILSQE